MILTPNTFNQQTPFFYSYSEYQPPTGTTLASNVEDMISYSIMANGQPVDLNYSIGTENTYEFSILLKNITTNTVLEVQLSQDRPIFNTATPNSFNLTPDETKSIDLSLNKNYLNDTATIFNFLATLSILILSRKDGTVELVSLTTAKFAPQQLSNITVT